MKKLTKKQQDILRALATDATLFFNDTGKGRFLIEYADGMVCTLPAKVTDDFFEDGQELVEMAKRVKGTRETFEYRLTALGREAAAKPTDTPKEAE